MKTKGTKYLAINFAGLFIHIHGANTMKAVVRKARIRKDYEDGRDFLLFRADGDEIVRVHRNGSPASIARYRG